MVGSAALFFLVKTVITVFLPEVRLHMPRLPKNSLPKYRLHRPSGCAVVTLSGKVHYLGKYDSEESRDLYNRLIAEWLTAGQAVRPTHDDSDFTISELCNAYGSRLHNRLGDSGFFFEKGVEWLRVIASPSHPWGDSSITERKSQIPSQTRDKSPGLPTWLTAWT